MFKQTKLSWIKSDENKNISTCLIDGCTWILWIIFPSFSQQNAFIVWELVTCNVNKEIHSCYKSLMVYDLGNIWIARD